MNIYRVLHYWAGDEPPTEYFMAYPHEPTASEAIRECGIDFDPDETLGIQPVQVHGAKMLVEVGGVDWAQLRAQKLQLLEAAERNPELHGIVNLLDEIQDQASVSLGKETVFGVGERPEE